MQQADSSQISPRSRFPALDPEPPPRPWRRIGVTLIILLAGLGSWVGYVLSGTAPHHRSPAISVSFVRGLTGVVLAETPGGYLSETDLHTGNAVVFKRLGQFSSNPDPAVSADGRYLLDAAVGRLVSISSFGHLQTVPNALSFAPGDTPGFSADPWSDHDIGVVELSYPNGAEGVQSPIPVADVEPVRTGRAASLGRADSAAGDQQQEGAFIAVPKRGKPLPNGNQPDAKLVLTDAGSRPRLLATTARLNRVLGVKRGAATTSLVPIPNPQGSMVAVAVSSLKGANYYSAGIVVVSRKGRVLGSQRGASAFSWAAWSHSGKTLAFVGYGQAGPRSPSGQSVPAA